MAVRQLSVFLENRTGTLCEVTQALSDNGIDVRAITLATGMANYHSRDEYITVENLEGTARLVEQLILGARK